MYTLRPSKDGEATYVTKLRKDALRRIAQNEIARRERAIAAHEYEAELRRRTNISGGAYSPYAEEASAIRAQVWKGYETLRHRMARKIGSWFKSV